MLLTLVSADNNKYMYLFADDEIRQNEGFKNVHLLNVVKAGNAAMKIKFVSDEDAELIKM